MAQVKLTKRERDSIQSAVNKLNKIRGKLQEKHPEKDINWFLEDTANLMLLETSSHDDRCHKFNEDAVIDCFDFYDASGGSC